MLALLILAVMAPAARAQTTLSDVTNLHVSADQLLADEVQIGLRFWRDRGQMACPDGITAWLGDLPGDANGGLHCGIFMDESEIAATRGRLARHDVYAPDIITECTVVVHEVGHALGLEHAATGIMAAIPESPWICVHIGLGMERAEHARRRALRHHARLMRRESERARACGSLRCRRPS
jgi:hypothetical protein